MCWDFDTRTAEMRRPKQRDAKARFGKVTRHDSRIRSLQTEVAEESLRVKAEAARHSEAARFRVPVNQAATAEYAAANNTL